LWLCCLYWLYLLDIMDMVAVYIGFTFWLALLGMLAVYASC